MTESATNTPQDDPHEPRFDAAKERLSWGDRWRLERLSDGQIEDFPGSAQFYVGLSTLEKKPRRPIIAIGEEGSGESTFSTWLREDPATHIVDMEQFTGSALNELLDFVFGQQVPGTLESFVKEYNKQTLVLRHLDRLEPRLGKRLLGLFRGLYDGNHGVSLSLFLLGRDQRAFDMEPFSAIVQVSQLCRLPRFNEHDLRELIIRRSGKNNDLDEGAAATTSQTIHKLTGGQPLLAERALREAVLGKTLVEGKLLAQLRDYPPSSLIKWQQRLARMVDSEPSLRAAARDLSAGREYAIGGSDPSQWAPHMARALSLSGWMSPGRGPNGPNTVWRMSNLHRAWAAPVIRDPRRFLGPRMDSPT